MFLRGRHPEPTVWPRFRAAGDGFAVRRRDGIVETSVRASASRVVDLFLALIEELPPAVSMYLLDVRTSRQWTGEALALPDVGEALARLKLQLTTYAGAEIAVFSPDEQITLTPTLTLFCYAHSERWVFLLRGLGLVERNLIEGRSWRLERDDFPPAREASEGIELAAERLKLSGL
jgi:hypothetical protein